MSSRRLLYDDMRDRGLLNRCGYALELYEIEHRSKTTPFRYKQHCSLSDGEKCIYSNSEHMPTRQESFACPLYKLFHESAVAAYNRLKKTDFFMGPRNAEAEKGLDYESSQLAINGGISTSDRSSFSYFVLPEDFDLTRNLALQKARGARRYTERKKHHLQEVGLKEVI